jgi:hypothetical protein
MKMKRHLLLLAFLALILGTALRSYFPPISRVQIEDVEFDVAVEWQKDTGYVPNENGTAALSSYFLTWFESHVLFLHNHLDGWRLYEAQVGDTVNIHFGQTEIERKITDIQIYQRIDGDDFIDPAGNPVNANALSARVFQSGHLVLQTCYEKDGDPTWGLIFIQVEL